MNRLLAVLIRHMLNVEDVTLADWRRNRQSPPKSFIFLNARPFGKSVCCIKQVT